MPKNFQKQRKRYLMWDLITDTRITFHRLWG